MKQEGFDNYIQKHVQKGIPFIAYWFPRGYGLLVTGKQYLSDENGNMRKMGVRKAEIQKWKKNVSKLRREWYGDFITAEFDGENVVYDPEW